MSNKIQDPVTVVAVDRNLAGSIDGYLMSNNVFLTRRQMVRLVEEGWVFGYVVATDRFGGKSIKTTPNSPVQRLQTLPNISELGDTKIKSIRKINDTSLSQRLARRKH